MTTPKISLAALLNMYSRYPLDVLFKMDIYLNFSVEPAASTNIFIMFKNS